MGPATTAWWHSAWRRLRGNPAAAPAADPAAAPGTQVGAYQLVRLLGRGAMSEVHLAVHRDSGQTVALKIFAFETATGEAWADARQRFLAEAALARRLRHPDIVAVLDAGDAPGLAWMAMEFVEGHDLSRYTAPARLLPELLVLAIGERLARALAHAHKLGIVHRDVKPSNVRVDLPHDVVKLGDFGVARLADAARTRTGLVVGTPAYMAPELLAGGEPGPAADVHALSVMLYELLTARRPYRGDTLGELMRAVAHDPVPDLCALRPELPSALGALLAHGLAKRPEERIAQARDLADALAALRAGWPAPPA